MTSGIASTHLARLRCPNLHPPPPSASARRPPPPCQNPPSHQEFLSPAAGINPPNSTKSAQSAPKFPLACPAHMNLPADTLPGASAVCHWDGFLQHDGASQPHPLCTCWATLPCFFYSYRNLYPSTCILLRHMVFWVFLVGPSWFFPAVSFMVPPPGGGRPPQLRLAALL